MTDVVIVQQSIIRSLCRKIFRKGRKLPEIDLSNEERETGTLFAPKFGADGLLTAVVVDAADNSVLMLAHMDQEALAATIDSGEAHFHSRSRGRLWKKGETSGNVLRVREILVDCDQDALVLVAEAAGPACHTGERSCFYRKFEDGALVPVKT